METRPKIKLQLSRTDKFLEKSGLILQSVMWCLAIYIYYISPAIIPIHYNFSGQPDKYGSRWTLFIGPGIASLVYCFVTTLNQYPHIFNYMVTITGKNAPEQYSLATRILRFLKVSVVIIVSIVTFYAYLSARGHSNGPGVWFLPFMLILLLSPTIVLIIRSFSSKRT